MDLLKRRMANLITELLLREDLSIEERFNAVLMAMDVARLPRTPNQIEVMRKYWHEAVKSHQVRRKKS